MAYTGGVVNLWGDSSVFDLSGIEYNDKLAALVNHDPNQRAGVIDQIAVSNQIAISGKFLTTSHGSTVQAESKEGFPWQMSIGVQPRSYEILREGSTIVNGQAVSAPAYIYRNNTITEISFVPVGADTNTTAFALSGIQEINKTADKSNMSEQAPDYAAQTSAKDAEITALKAQLQSAQENARKQEIKQLEQTAGIQLSETEKAFLLPLNAEQFATSVQLMSKAAAKPNTDGLSKDFKLDGGASGKSQLSAGQSLIEKAKGAK
ncbi:MAG: hypothetical protein PHE17_19580 [Thiothrix sp.]|uniref:hypothetical protein n=1 Tax=Thiothrix sp. TaxID=1032 RepID=UPI002612F1D0|nr:hypothetical protein [Thiothrix sp.]MDD5395230.1 hypothetical protein [Thiothrix sp.]